MAVFNIKDYEGGKPLEHRHSSARRLQMQGLIAELDPRLQPQKRLITKATKVHEAEA